MRERRRERGMSEEKMKVGKMREGGEGERGRRSKKEVERPTVRMLEREIDRGKEGRRYRDVLYVQQGIFMKTPLDTPG